MDLPNYQQQYEDENRLGRQYTLDGKREDCSFLRRETIYSVLRAAEAARNDEIAESQRLLGLPGSAPADDVVAAIRLLPGERRLLDQVEVELIEAALDGGASWSSLAAALGRSSRQAMQQRYRRLGGTRTWPRPGTAQD